MAIEIINLLNGISIIGAARETRTLMGYFPLGPQPSLSTNFSMAAYAAD